MERNPITYTATGNSEIDGHLYNLARSFVEHTEINQAKDRLRHNLFQFNQAISALNSIDQEALPNASDADFESSRLILSQIGYADHFENAIDLLENKKHRLNELQRKSALTLIKLGNPFYDRSFDVSLSERFVRYCSETHAGPDENDPNWLNSQINILMAELCDHLPYGIRIQNFSIHPPLHDSPTPVSRIYFSSLDEEAVRSGLNRFGLYLAGDLSEKDLQPMAKELSYQSGIYFQGQRSIDPLNSKKIDSKAFRKEFPIFQADSDFSEQHALQTASSFDEMLESALDFSEALSNQFENLYQNLLNSNFKFEFKNNRPNPTF